MGRAINATAAEAGIHVVRELHQAMVPSSPMASAYVTVDGVVVAAEPALLARALSTTAGEEAEDADNPGQRVIGRIVLNFNRLRRRFCPANVLCRERCGGPTTSRQSL